MKRILLIDDDNQLRKMLERLLGRVGYDITACGDGRTGLKLFGKAGPWDLIITDIVMPEVEGIDFIVQIREINPKVPIVAISGGGRNNPQAYLKMADKLGADAGLAKPFSNTELLDVVQDLVNRDDVPQAAGTAN